MEYCYYYYFLSKEIKRWEQLPKVRADLILPEAVGLRSQLGLRSPPGGNTQDRVYLCDCDKRPQLKSWLCHLLAT